MFISTEIAPKSSFFKLLRPILDDKMFTQLQKTTFWELFFGSQQNINKRCFGKRDRTFDERTYLKSLNLQNHLPPTQGTFFLKIWLSEMNHVNKKEQIRPVWWLNLFMVLSFSVKKIWRTFQACGIMFKKIVFSMNFCFACPGRNANCDSDDYCIQWSKSQPSSILWNNNTLQNFEMRQISSKKKQQFYAQIIDWIRSKR